MDNILSMLEKDAKLTPEQIAVMTGMDTGDIRKAIEEYEKSGAIIAYKTLIDWDKADREHVCAIIELKVIPQQDEGFDYIAKLVCNYPEVESMYLMSGTYDFQIVMEGKSLKEVANFVTKKLSTIKGVTSTATHFVLKKYKEFGTVFQSQKIDTRDTLI